MTIFAAQVGLGVCAAVLTIWALGSLNFWIRRSIIWELWNRVEILVRNGSIQCLRCIPVSHCQALRKSVPTGRRRCEGKTAMSEVWVVLTC